MNECMSLLCRNDKPSGTFVAVNSNPKAGRDAFKWPCLLLTGFNLNVLLVILIEHKRISSKWLEPRPWNLASDFPLSLAFNVERSRLENRVRIFRLKNQSSSLSFSKGIIFLCDRVQMVSNIRTKMSLVQHNAVSFADKSHANDTWLIPWQINISFINVPYFKGLIRNKRFKSM